MKPNGIKYPIALSKETGELINAKDAENGLNCNCCCIDCSDDLIAINKDGNKLRPHFKHKGEPSCKGGFESYIHALTKKLFFEIEFIILPEIRVKDLINRWDNSFFTNELSNLLEGDIIKKGFVNDISFANVVLQESKKLEIEEIEIEKVFNTSLGDIRVDIAVAFGAHKLLIEPFFTSQIDNGKAKKIEMLDKSTLVLDLLSFVKQRDYQFEISEVIEYLQSKISKKWYHIRKEKIKQLQNSFNKKMTLKLESGGILISNYNTKILELKDLQDDFIAKCRQMHKAKDALTQVENRIEEMKKGMVKHFKGF